MQIRLLESSSLPVMVGAIGAAALLGGLLLCGAVFAARKFCGTSARPPPPPPGVPPPPGPPPSKWNVKASLSGWGIRATQTIPMINKYPVPEGVSLPDPQGGQAHYGQF